MLTRNADEMWPDEELNTESGCLCYANNVCARCHCLWCQVKLPVGRDGHTSGHLMGDCLCSWQVYWVGPILGAILAAGLYEYLYCPDPELKKGLKMVFHKDSAGRYREVEAEDVAIKPTVSDREKGEKKESFQDPAGEVLSSV